MKDEILSEIKSIIENMSVKNLKRLLSFIQGLTKDNVRLPIIFC
jgi:hypothetical protein